LLRASEGLNEARNKDDYEPNLELLEALIRDALLVSVGADEERIVNVDVLPQLKQLASGVNGTRAVEWIAKIEEVREQLFVNINRKSATDGLFFTMADAS
jgi:hypothetical protein